MAEEQFKFPDEIEEEVPAVKAEAEEKPGIEIEIVDDRPEEDQKNAQPLPEEIVKEIGDDYTKLASDIDETETYVDTGSYIFNALVSGSIFGGVSGNKITAIAGESSTGKTFFSLAVVKNFLDTHPDGYCLYFDTEAAVNKSLIESRGIDTNRFVVVNVVTIEEFRSKALKAVDLYLKKLLS